MLFFKNDDWWWFFFFFYYLRKLTEPFKQLQLQVYRILLGISGWFNKALEKLMQWKPKELELKNMQQKKKRWETEEKWEEIQLFSCAQHARYVVKRWGKRRGEQSDKIKKRHKTDELSTLQIFILA